MVLSWLSCEDPKDQITVDQLYSAPGRGMMWGFYDISRRSLTIGSRRFLLGPNLDKWNASVLQKSLPPKNLNIKPWTIYFNIRILGMMREGIWKITVYVVMSLKVAWRRYNENIVTWRAFICVCHVYILYIVWKISKIKNVFMTIRLWF